MNYILAGLAVYKMLQVIDVLLPKEVMPWVKIVAGVAIGYGASFVAGIDEKALGGLVVATIAGSTHTLLRLATLMGDMAQKKSYR